MTTSAEWTERIVELRELAESTPDRERKQRYLELAQRWEVFAAELEDAAKETAVTETAPT